MTLAMQQSIIADVLYSCIIAYLHNQLCERQARMTRTTISLSDDLAEMARNEARRRGVSLSAVVREALKSALVKPPGAKLPWQGIVSDSSIPARSLDEILAESWSDRIAGDR